MNARYNNAAPVKQQGAALLVSMVLIFMLTILGIASMRDATLEGQLAANAVQKEVTFQSAESATDTVLAINDTDDEKAIESVICMPDVEFVLDDLSEADVQDTNVTLAYGGRSLPTGWSLGGPIGGRRFTVTGESNLPSASTGTKISQGVVAIGAVAQGISC